jgi:hemolysin III
MELDMCSHSHTAIDRNRSIDSDPVSTGSAASSSEMPGKISWNYDRTELIADGVVHATGVVLGLIGAIAIVIVAVEARLIEIVSVGIYIFGLVAMLVLSAAYNMWPISSTKWILRRFDHSAIYLLIAGTYTPFLAVMKSGIASVALGVGVWSSALIGIVVKLALPGRFDRLAVALYLLLGWCGVVAYDLVATAVPSTSLWLLVIGGVLYSIGTVFHGWRRLRFHNAIWHGFVLSAAGCHYSAVLNCLASG